MFPRSRPLVRDLGELGTPLRPALDDLAALFGSFDDAGGIEELMRFIYFYTGSVNGEDELGPLHPLRSDRQPRQLRRRGRPVASAAATSASLIISTEAASTSTH